MSDEMHEINTWCMCADNFTVVSEAQESLGDGVLRHALAPPLAGPPESALQVPAHATMPGPLTTPYADSST